MSGERCVAWVEACLRAGRDEEPYLRATVLARAARPSRRPHGRRAVFRAETSATSSTSLNAANVRRFRSSSRPTTAPPPTRRLVLVDMLRKVCRRSRWSGCGSSLTRARGVRPPRRRLRLHGHAAHPRRRPLAGDLDDAMAEAHRAIPFVRRCGDRFSLSRVSYISGLVADLPRGDTARHTANSRTACGCSTRSVCTSS